MAQLTCSTSAREPCFRSFCASLQTPVIRDRALQRSLPKAAAGSSRSSSAMNSTPSSCCPDDGSSNERSRGSTDVAGSPRTGRITIERRSLSCTSHQSASCCENYAIPPNLSGQTLRRTTKAETDAIWLAAWACDPKAGRSFLRNHQQTAAPDHAHHGRITQLRSFEHLQPGGEIRRDLCALPWTGDSLNGEPYTQLKTGAWSKRNSLISY